jgi:hypothetical protein
MYENRTIEILLLQYTEKVIASLNLKNKLTRITGAKVKWYKSLRLKSECRARCMQDCPLETHLVGKAREGTTRLVSWE